MLEPLTGAIDWAVQAGGASSDNRIGSRFGIVHDGAGGALVTGYFSGEASFGSTSLTSRGEFDAFVMHVTASGAINWPSRRAARPLTEATASHTMAWEGLS